MARARMIARNITKSKKIAQLSDAQRVMYAFILPFLDREGRINAHPTYLKGNVFLHLEYTEAQIEAAVRKFHDVGLATVYATEDDVVMEYEGFLNYNRPDRKEVVSEYPAPTEEARTPTRTPSNPRGIAVALPGQSLGMSSGEVEVEEEVEEKKTSRKKPRRRRPSKLGINRRRPNEQSLSLLFSGVWATATPTTAPARRSISLPSASPKTPREIAGSTSSRRGCRRSSPSPSGSSRTLGACSKASSSSSSTAKLAPIPSRRRPSPPCSGRPPRAGITTT